MTKNEIGLKYIKQANQLEVEFFDIIAKGLPNQQRVGKVDKSINEFNQKHREIWRSHEAELIATGLMEAPVPREPSRDLATEIDELKTRLEKLEKK